MVAAFSKVLSRKLIGPSGSHGGSHALARWTRPPSFSTSAAVTHSQEAQGQSVWSKMLLFVPGTISFGLGTWQIFRRQEKIKTLEYQKDRLEMEPLKCEQIAENSNSLEFRRVRCKGVFDQKSSIFVGPRSRTISGVSENGYYVITPLNTTNHPENSENVQTILVNRGWVPRSWRDNSVEIPQVSQQLPNPSSPSPARENARSSSSWWQFWSKEQKKVEEKDHPALINTVEVIGVIRGSEKPSIFVPANDPKSGQWFYVDVPAIAKACGLPENTVYIEDINENIDSGNPYPVPKDANTLIRSSVMPQDHLNYMLTWYSLSAAVTFMAFKRLNPKNETKIVGPLAIPLDCILLLIAPAMMWISRTKIFDNFDHRLHREPLKYSNTLHFTNQ